MALLSCTPPVSITLSSSWMLQADLGYWNINFEVLGLQTPLLLNKKKYDMISFRFLSYNPYSMLYLRGKFGTIIIFSLSMIIFVASTCCSQPGVVCSMQYSISVVLPLESPPMRMVQAGEVQAECLARSCISLREKIQSNPSSRTQVFWVSSSTRIKGYIN